MHELYELKEKLMKELTEYAQNGKFSKEDAEAIKYIASSIDHICNIVERMEEEEYSERGGGQGGNSRYSYEGSNYARGGNRGGSSRGQGSNYNSREGGSYARGRGQNARRDSMGRYSRAGDPEQMIEQLEDMMQDAPNEQIKKDIQRLVEKMESM